MSFRGSYFDCLWVLALFFLAGCTSEENRGPSSSVSLTDNGASEDILVDILVGVDVQADLSSEPDSSKPDLGPGPDMSVFCQAGAGCFGDPCSSNEDCEDGICISHMGNKVCSEPCLEDCPQGWKCKQIQLTGTDLIFACVSDFTHLCQPCRTNEDCRTGEVQDVCLDYAEEGAFCGALCEDTEDCPDGFECVDFAGVEGGASKQCVNSAGVCECSEWAISAGLPTVCNSSNEFGTCGGERICTESGLGSCDAPEPANDICNGLDDDCDGATDEVDCNDGNECTKDSCAGKDGCVHEAMLDASCDDGDLGTRNDLCTAEGKCEGEPFICEGGPCVVKATPNGATCDIDYKPAGSDCDDGKADTKDDVCTMDGVCKGTGYTCTPGQCELSATTDGIGCALEFQMKGYECDDGDPKTQDDICDGFGGCGGTAYNCEVTQCIESSVPNGFDCDVVYKADTEGCDDEDVTTKNDFCDGEGACAGTAYECAPTQCQMSSTHNGADCTVVNKAPGEGCDDGEDGTRDDICDGSGVCAGTAYECVPTQCQVSSTPNGIDCTVENKIQFEGCDDGKNDTRDDVCDGSGGCSGTAYECAPKQCQVSSTHNGIDCTIEYEGSGVVCDDGKNNTQNDICDGSGGCFGMAYDCVANQCQESSIPNGTDCTIDNKPEGEVCDDGKNDTRDDICDGSGGCFGMAYECVANQCQASSTHNGIDCTVEDKALGVGCDDGQENTRDDICDGSGACTGTAYECVATQCEVSSIHNGIDCTIVDKGSGAACDDGKSETKIDICDGFGGCSGTAYECVANQCQASSTHNGVDCTIEDKALGVGCDDGKNDTRDDICDGAGACNGTAYECVANQCQASSTHNGIDCTIEDKALGVGCDDGKDNTRDDICDGSGVCTGSAYECVATQCEASSIHNGIDCTISDKGSGAACDDGKSETKIDICDGVGGCSGTAYECAPTQCQASSTHNGIDCTIEDKAPGVGCDDGKNDTRDDICDGSGGCLGTAYECVPNQCQSSSTQNGTDCTVENKDQGAGCDDGKDDTRDDVCDGSGGCAGVAYECIPNQCQVSATHNGIDCTIENKDAGKSCDDGDVSTRDDICDGSGGCAGETYTCEVGQCTVSAEANGVDCTEVHKEAGVQCDDADANTKYDECNGLGMCTGSAYTCVPGICESESIADGFDCAVVYASAGTSCDDGDSETEGDFCDGVGGCAGGVVAGEDCSNIQTQNPNAVDGTYWIDPDGEGGNEPFPVYCDMTTDSGGWTLVAAAIGGQPPVDDWGGTTGVNVGYTAPNGETFRFSDSRITSIRQISNLMRYTKSHGSTVYAVPPPSFDSKATGIPTGDVLAEVGPELACLDEALTIACESTEMDGDTGPWATYVAAASPWSAAHAAVLVGNGPSCAGNFGVTDHGCDDEHWNDPDVWLQLWLRGDICGDGACNAGEDCSTCTVDCACDSATICSAGECLPDGDEDGVPDQNDNCPEISNEGQEDLDKDLIGDVCDPFTCGNGICEKTEILIDDSDVVALNKAVESGDFSTLRCSSQIAGEGEVVGGTIVLNPVSDSYVSSSFSSSNYGTSTELKVDRTYEQTYLRFDLSSIPSGTIIQEATFTITAYTGFAYGGDGYVYARFVDDDSWLENSITYNNAPSFDSSSSLGTWFLWYDWGDYTENTVNMSTTKLRDALRTEFAGDRQFSLRLNSPGYRTNYRSREFSDSTKRPKLTVSYVPQCPSLCGDTNADGVVNSADIEVIEGIIAGDDASACVRWAADVTVGGEDCGTCAADCLCEEGTACSEGACAADGDLDGVADADDNCPAISNPDQSDLDGDLLGDLCDPETCAGGTDCDQPAGQKAFSYPGVFSWVAPEGVTRVSVVAVGGGGASNGFQGGGGGGLGWRNQIAVNPGEAYTVVVGAGGFRSSNIDNGGEPGGDSYFISGSIVKGGGGGTNAGGDYLGDGGGQGGQGSSSSGYGGGGGAGGYAGKGGDGGVSGSAGQGGGGGGGADGGGSGGGGGVGIYGQGMNGAGGVGSPYKGGFPGSGGICAQGEGLNAICASSDLNGGLHGGGSGSAHTLNNSRGGDGALRIIWGTGRAFPNTLTEDQ